MLDNAARVSDVHHVARATLGIEIDVAVSQVTQAEAVTDIEWLDRWLNFCHLGNATENILP